MRGYRVAAWAAACVMFGGLAACGGSSHPVSGATHTPAARRPANAQLTVSQARSIFAAFLPRFNQLPTVPSLAGVLTTGPETATEKFLNGKAGFAVGTLTGQRFLVPELAGYPRWFLAGGSAADTQGFLFLMVQQSAGAPWREAAEMYDQNKPQILPDLKTVGFATSGYASTVPSTDATLTTEPAALSAAYAQYLNDGGHGAAGHSFVAGSYTTLYLRQNQQIAASAKALGWHFTDEHGASALPAYSLLLPGGAGALVVFFTDETLSWTARSSSARVPRSASQFPSLPPLQFLSELGIKTARPGLRVTASSVDECLAFVGPTGSEGAAVVINAGKGTGVSKSG